ncbi:MAG: alpha/beta hydrolase [Micrococcales bacterium]|nr:alpha/beta hydrolase [Micrococcales bacterium]
MLSVPPDAAAHSPRDRRRPGRRRGILRGIAAGVATIVVLSAVLGTGLALGQRHLIYFPDRSDPGPAAAHVTGGRDVQFTTADGLRLNAWLVVPTAGAQDVAVLWLPGNAGNRGGRAGIAQELAGLGYTVLLVDYRGYGGNPGTPSENGLALDARAAAAYLRGQGFPADRTLYVGESIGTGVAVRLATTDPPAGIVLRSPYTSLVDVARQQFPWLPVGLILRDRFDTLSYLPAIDVPVTVLCGSADTLVPAGQSATVARHVRTLFRFTQLDGVGHNDAVWYGAFMAQQVADLARATIAT